MKKIIFTLIVFCVYASDYAQDQKIISDCTITYLVSSLNSSLQDKLGSKIVYIKGKSIRIDLISKNFTQTVFYNGSDGNATVLKNIGDSKYISEYNALKWQKANEIYNGLAISFTDSTKKILDYNCKQAIIKLKNGNVYFVYFAPALMPSVMESPFEFKNIPGLVLEYKSLVNDKEAITYTAEKIDFKPVPSLQFNIPKTGYRILQ